MACWLYEGILMFGVVFIASYLFDTLSQSRHALANRGLRMGFLFVVFGIYFGWFWSRGQTLAQKTWHIRVVSLTARQSRKRALRCATCCAGSGSFRPWPPIPSVCQPLKCWSCWLDG